MRSEITEATGLPASFVITNQEIDPHWPGRLDPKGAGNPVYPGIPDALGPDFNRGFASPQKMAFLMELATDHQRDTNIPPAGAVYAAAVPEDDGDLQPKFQESPPINKDATTMQTLTAHDQFLMPAVVGSALGILATAAIIIGAYLSDQMAFQQRDSGNAAYQAGNHQASLQYHLKAVSIVTGDPAYRSDLAHTYLALERYDMAITEYTAALAMDPGFQPALCGRGLTYRAIGAERLAQVDFRKAQLTTGQPCP